MADWDPSLYRRFEDERTRPAQDLLARVPIKQPAGIIDLGCGPGNSTELLVRRFPGTPILGLDSSNAMLEAARERLPFVRFEHGDAATWRPEHPVDLIFANAVLQWLPDHDTLIPRLFGLLPPGGVLALQMPDNLDEASHRAMRTVASQDPWAERLQPAVASRSRLASPSVYYDLLSPQATVVDIWRTAYQHVLASPAAIVEWLGSTGLRPYLDLLETGEREAFLSRYETQLAADYPVRADGARLLAFPRLFVVAQRRP